MTLAGPLEEEGAREIPLTSLPACERDSTADPRNRWKAEDVLRGRALCPLPCGPHLGAPPHILDGPPWAVLLRPARPQALPPQQGLADCGHVSWRPEEGGLTWWQVSARAVHTKTPEMPRARGVVRNSWEVPWELFPTWSPCSSPAGSVGMAARGLGCCPVADAWGALPAARSPGALVIRQGWEDSGPWRRREQRCPEAGRSPGLGGEGGSGEGRLLPKAAGCWALVAGSSQGGGGGHV